MRKVLSSILFITFAISIFFYLNWLFLPSYISWNNFDTTHGIYEEPKNTIEVLFLGSSYTVTGVIPIELYEKYGICSYNLGTEQQPLLASYYWLKEVYENHSKTLKTIVLDPEMLFHAPSEAFTQKALDGMRFSKNKIEAWADFSYEWEDMFRAVPLVSYHRRWTLLSKTDFSKNEHIIQRFNRGYWIQTSNLLQNYNLEEIPIPSYYLDKSVQEQKISEQGLKFFEKLKDFCKSHSLNLVIAKTPTNKWTSSKHLAVEQKLEGKSPFLDFNFVPLIDEIHFSFATDTFDIGDPEHLHLNYYGATKYTDWIGNYLIQNHLATDIRGQEKYAFMENQLKEWHKNVTIPESEIDE